MLNMSSIRPSRHSFSELMNCRKKNELRNLITFINLWSLYCIWGIVLCMYVCTYICMYIVLCYMFFGRITSLNLCSFFYFQYIIFLLVYSVWIPEATTPLHLWVHPDHAYEQLLCFIKEEVTCIILLYSAPSSW